MISDAPTFEDLAGFGAEICVIGAGPVGIVTALALSAGGRRVLLLESGGRAAASAAQALSQAEDYSRATQHPPEIAMARRLGGASNLWGGRVLPFDALDFRARLWLGLEAWPIAGGDLAAQASAACAMLGAGAAVWREPLPGVAADDAFGFECSSAGATCRGFQSCTATPWPPARTSSSRWERRRPASCAMPAGWRRWRSTSSDAGTAG